jgi:hypothetical protein
MQVVEEGAVSMQRGTQAVGHVDMFGRKDQLNCRRLCECAKIPLEPQ